MYPYNFSNPVELNRYVYTANDPINGFDPSGQFLEPAVIHSRIVKAVAAITGVGVAAASYFARASLIISSYLPSLLSLSTRQVMDLIQTGQFVRQALAGDWGVGGGGGGGDNGGGDDKDGDDGGEGLIGATGGPYETTPNQLADYDKKTRTLMMTVVQRQEYEIFVKDGKLVYRDGSVVTYGRRKESMAVMDGEGHIYFSSGGFAGRIRHSSFTAGGDLAYAGTWDIQYGTLKVITADSGHYVPEYPKMNNQLLQELRARGLDTSQISSIWKKEDMK